MVYAERADHVFSISIAPVHGKISTLHEIVALHHLHGTWPR